MNELIVGMLAILGTLIFGFFLIIFVARWINHTPYKRTAGCRPPKRRGCRS